MATESKHGKSKVEEAHYELPGAQTIHEAGELMIQDEWGREVPFRALTSRKCRMAQLKSELTSAIIDAVKSLYENKEGTQQLIIFIRHFFCHDCEDYVRTLSEELPPAFLNNTTPGTKLFIVGCGQMGAIPDYRTRTMQTVLHADKHYPIYCDPSRKLYTKLGMMSNLNTGDKAPEYVKKGVVEAVATGVKNAVTAGTDIVKGGHPAQNGGEMLFANGECVWFKRMRHTQDHAEVAELKEVLGLQ